MYKQQNEAFDLLDKDEVEGVLSGAFYHPPPPAPERPRAKPLSKPEHYKVICISLYKDDLQQLDRMVKELKSRGLTKANRSALIRQALLQIDLDKVPKGI
ncbi:MAG: ribbon-helix-helix domain-containing protein [Polyangiaceae bacterium]